MKTEILHCLKTELSVIVEHTSINNLDRHSKIVQSYFDVMKQIRDLPTFRFTESGLSEDTQLFSFVDSGDTNYPYKKVNIKKGSHSS